jgi:hypothetical protein
LIEALTQALRHDVPAHHPIRTSDREKLGALLDLKYGSVNDAIERLSDADTIAKTFVGFQRHLYEA